MRDYARAAGIVDQGVEPALGGTDRGGEAFDGARILRRRAARAVAGTGQAGNQPVGRLGIAPKGDYDTGPGLCEEACGRSTQAFAAACHQRYPSVEHAHDLSFKAAAIQKLPNWRRIPSLWSWTAVRARGVWWVDGRCKIAVRHGGEHEPSRRAGATTYGRVWLQIRCRLSGHQFSMKSWIISCSSLRQRQYPSRSMRLRNSLR